MWLKCLTTSFIVFRIFFAIFCLFCNLLGNWTDRLHRLLVGLHSVDSRHLPALTVSRHLSSFHFIWAPDDVLFSSSALHCFCRRLLFIDRGQGQVEKVRPWCGQPSDRGRLKEQNRTEQNCSLFAARLSQYTSAYSLMVRYCSESSRHRYQKMNSTQQRITDTGVWHL